MHCGFTAAFAAFGTAPTVSAIARAHPAIAAEIFLKDFLIVNLPPILFCPVTLLLPDNHVATTFPIS